MPPELGYGGAVPPLARQRDTAKPALPRIAGCGKRKSAGVAAESRVGEFGLRRGEQRARLCWHGRKGRAFSDDELRVSPTDSKRRNCTVEFTIGPKGASARRFARPECSFQGINNVNSGRLEVENLNAVWRIG